MLYDLHRLLGRYAYSVEASVNTHNYDLDSMTAMKSLYAGHTIEMSCVFNSRDLNRFLEALELVEQEYRDKQKRDENSVLRRAYEEYQLLLKLS